MMRQDSTPPPRDLVWLRWLFTALSLMSPFLIARALHIPHLEIATPGFDLIYLLVVTLFTCGACALGWMNRWWGFVWFGIVSRTISAMGAVLYLAEMLLDAPSYPLKSHLGVIAWNVGAIGISFFTLVYLVRRFRPDVPSPSRSDAAPTALLVLRWIFTGATLIGAAPLAYFAREHWLYEHMYFTLCGALMTNTVVLGLMCVACICAWRGHWRSFVTLGFVSQALNTFGSLQTLTHYSLPREWRSPEDPSPFLAVNLLIFASAVFLLVYLPRRFSPLDRRSA
jgi:hypothetical protein